MIQIHKITSKKNLYIKNDFKNDFKKSFFYNYN